MGGLVELRTRGVLIGVGASALMNGWALYARRGVPHTVYGIGLDGSAVTRSILRTWAAPTL